VKRGQLGSQLMIFVFLFLLILVAGGVVAGTYIFFGQGYDIRQAEADALNIHIASCLQEKIIDWKVAGDFYNQCGLSSDALNSSIYLIRIRDCVNDNCNLGNIVFSLGSNFEACSLTGKNKAYPKCTIKKIYLKDKIYELVTGSNQLPRRPLI